MSQDGRDCSEIQYNQALAEICDSLDLFWNLQNMDGSWHQDNLVYLEIQDNLVLLETRDSLDLFWSLQRMDCSWCWDSPDCSKDLKNLDNPEFSNALEYRSETLNSQGTLYRHWGCYFCSRLTCWYGLFTTER